MSLTTICVEPFSGESAERVLVRSGSVSHVYSLSAELLNSISTESLKSFQWYFERHATDEPFAYARARVVYRRLRDQGKLLLKNFLLPDVCPCPDVRNDYLIEIIANSDLGSGDFSLYKFFWEVLEDRSLWHDVLKVRPRSVTVVRVCRRKDDEGEDGEAEKVSSKAALRTKNVLAITARPSYTADIPHRLITRSIFAAVNRTVDKSQAAASLEIVRPSTFEALAEYLAKGHFDIVHLDLHGGTDSQGAYFVFTKTGPLANMQPDNVPAWRVASLLIKHGVTTVVMNACRSATAFNEVSNAASFLVWSGIKAVIGMSFNVYSLSADSFMRDFYDYYIGQDVSILEAVSYARERLHQNNVRMSKYHTKVEIEDHVVPILYYQETELQSLVEHNILIPTHTERARAISSSIVPKLASDLIGREGDILRIERMLAEFPNIKIHLQGEPGIGKSALLTEATLWWQKTGLFRQVVYIQFTDRQLGNCTARAILLSIAEKLNIDAGGLSNNELISSFNKCSFILVLDSVDSISWSSQGSLANHQEQFRLCLKRMKNFSIIVSSRSADDWLRSGVIQSRLLLEPLNMSNAIAVGTSVLHEASVPSCLLATQDDQSFFEQLIQLSRGNPLAIKILMYNLANHLAEDSTLQMSRHVLSLLQMRPIHLDIENLRSGRGARAVAELLSKAQELFKSDGAHDVILPGRCSGLFRSASTDGNDDKTLRLSIERLEVNRKYPLDSVQGRTRKDSKLTKSGLFPIMAFISSWHNFIFQVEPFVTTLATLLVARHDLEHDHFSKFRNRLCDYTKESEERSDYVRHALLSNEAFGLPRVTSRECLTLADEALSSFRTTLCEEYRDFVTGPARQVFGTSTHSFKESYYSLSPLLSLVFQSSCVRSHLSQTVADDVEVARDSLYRHRTSIWFRRYHQAHVPSSPFANALQVEIDFDFFNYLCYLISCQKLDSWPVGDHWQMQYLLAQALELDSRRTRLVERVLNQFIGICIQRIDRIRREFYSPQVGQYMIDRQKIDWRDWNMVTDLETACHSALIRAINCQEMLLKPLGEYTKQFQFLASRPMLLYSQSLNTEIRDLVARSLAMHARWLDFYQNGKGLDAEKIGDLLKSARDLTAGHHVAIGMRQPQSVLDTSLALPAQLLEISSAMGIGKDSVLYKGAKIMAQIGDSLDPTLLSQAVRGIENLLSEEVEKSNDIQICYQLHQHLASLYDKLGNRSLATQHRLIREDLGAMLEPGITAQIELGNNHWKAYHKSERQSRGEPTNEAQALEQRLNRLKAQLVEAEAQKDNELDILHFADTIGDTLRDLGRYPEAINYYKRVIDGRKQLLIPPTDKKTLLTIFARSKLLGDLQRFDESIPDLRMLCEAFASIGEQKIHAAVSGSLGLQLFNQAKLSSTSRTEGMRETLLKEASALLEEDVASLEDIFEPGDKNIAIRMSNLASVYEYQENFDKAESFYHLAIKAHRTRTSSEADESLIWAQNSLSMCYMHMQKYQAAEEILKRILEICIDHFELWHRTALTIMGNLHTVYLKREAENEATSFLEGYVSRFHKAMQDLAAKNKQDQFDFLRCKHDVGIKLAACESNDNAVVLLDEVCKAWLALGKQDEEMLKALKVLRLCLSSRKPPLLEEEFETSTKIIEHSRILKGPEHQDTLEAIATQVVCLRNMDRFNEAIELQLPLVEARKRVLGEKNQSTINNIGYLAYLYEDSKDWVAATKTRQEAFNILKALDPNSLTTLNQASRLAICHENLQQWDRVVDVRRDEYHRRREVQGADSPDTLLVLNELAFGLDKMGRHLEARATIDEVIDARTKILGSADFATLTSRRIKAMICRSLNQFDESEGILCDVLAVRAEHPMMDQTVIRALAGLGRTCVAKGQVERAREFFEEAIGATEELQGTEGLGVRLDDVVAELRGESAAL